jgi:hypothetical protein
MGGYSDFSAYITDSEKSLFPNEVVFKIMQFSQKSELEPAFYFPNLQF